MNRLTDEFVSENMGLVHSLANRFRNRGIEYEELVSAGCMGLVKAARGFDETRGLCFSTYAVPMIAGEIKRFLRDDGAIKVSRAIKTLSVKVRAYIDEHKKTHDTSPTIDELANHFDAAPEDIVVALDSAKDTVSLYERTDDKSESSPHLIDKLIVDDKSDQMLDNFILKTEIERLPERDKKILLLRYFRGKTQSEVAQMLNVSQVQVSRIEAKIIDALRKRMT